VTAIVADREEGALPPGQFTAHGHIRFGLGRFRRKVLPEAPPLSLWIGGDVASSLAVDGELASLPHIEQRSDFHCVTTWSVHGICWGGVRFSDFYRSVVLSHARPDAGADFVVLRGLDGYCCALPLDDLLAADVLLADQIEGRPLGLDHGAPLRLIAPAHYGYKSVKHLCAIEFRKGRRGYRFPLPYPSFMDHPRARVDREERARLLPNWLIRPIYRLFVPRSVMGS
jgi:DMSO/TMAO reductase YedYZ molybdopterin-dependent catalytic subunit